MPKRHLRKYLVDRVARELRAAGELGLAFLMTAGVASCGGKEATGGDGGTPAVREGGAKDAGRDQGIFMEAAMVEGGVIMEAAMVEGGVIIDGVSVDAGPVMEAAMVEGGVVIDGVSVDAGIAIEGAVFPDAGKH